MNDGSLVFDTRVDSTGFNRGVNGLKSQANGLTGAFNKLGVAIGAAFAVKAIADFSKQAVSLASDLAEVQNVVDVSFGEMAYKMEQFAETSIQTFGLSKLEAKRAGSSFMAMAKGMGMASGTASDMALDLTALSADMASFYNMTQAEAKTSLTSIFTGETETLKRYGILITEVNLQEYARQQGITKSINKMTQLEKVQLRYNYVMNATKQAQGDFARTSGSWANQVRILSEQWKEFATIIGQVFMTVLLPVVKVINQVLASLIKGAKYVAALFGAEFKSNPMGGLPQDVEDTSSGLDNVAESADKAKKAVKSLASVDEINKLSSTSSADIDGVGGGIDDVQLPEINTEPFEKADTVVTALQKKLQELQGIFRDGFKAGIGSDTEASFKRIKQNIQDIKQSLIDIATDHAVMASVDNFVNTFAYATGQIAGAMVSIGATAAENLTGGYSKYLNQNTPYIKERLVNIFDVSAEIAEQTGDTSEAIADIFEVFRSEEAQQCTADFIGIFENARLGIVETLLKVMRDVQKFLTKPIINNAQKIKATIMNTLKPISKVLSTINTGVKDTFNKIAEVYDENIAPAFERATEAASELMGVFLDTYNEHIAPVLQRLADGFAALWGEHIQPAIDKASEFFGKVAELLSAIYVNVIVPFGKWFSETILPLIAPVIEAVGKFFLEAGVFIADFVSGAMESLGGLVDFFTGVFSGDWDKAWQGIKDMFTGAWDGMLTNVTNVLNLIGQALLVAWEFIKTGFSSAWQSICAVFKGAWDTICNVVSVAVDGIKTGIATAFEWIKNLVSNIWNGIKNITSTVWNSIVGFVTGIITKLKTGISDGLTAIANNFSGVFLSIKNTVVNIFNSIWSFIKGIINSILGGIEGMCNGVINGFNGMIGAMNNVNFDVPDWVPAIGGKTFGFAIPQLRNISIPRLATGTVVPANYGEFMAILGDNNRETEVVSPLSTIKQALSEVMATMQGRAGGGDITIPIYLDGSLIDEVIVNAQQRRMVRSNGRA